MRDVNRIDEYCNKLAEIWKRYPDMRLGQLINNFQTYKNNDCFYMEDDIFIKELEKYMKFLVGE